MLQFRHLATWRAICLALTLQSGLILSDMMRAADVGDYPPIPAEYRRRSLVLEALAVMV